MDKNMHAVIMAGGQGTRLWPLSRQKQPKQFHSIVTEKSLIAETFTRLSQVFELKNIFVSTTPEYLSEIKKHLPEVPADNFIIEPYPMGTAAACGLASKIISLQDADAIVAFIPSDAHISDSEEFSRTLKYTGAACIGNPGHILTIGIKPSRADTRFGYIQLGEKFGTDGRYSAYKVKRFVEKPDAETAEQYLESGEYLWNAGMFVWQTKYMLNLFEKNLPKTDQVLKKISEHFGKPDFEEVLSENYHDVDNTSIDYGIMEKNTDILVVPGNFGWSDVGTWNTVLEVLSEIDGTDVVSRGHHLSVGDSNILVMAQEKLVATVGLEDIIVIDTPDALLVCKSDQAHKVKELLQRLENRNKNEYT